jgi:prophage tail gpP-like protein
MSNDLTLIINDRSLSGWTDIRVTRGIERCPNDFEIGMTERFGMDAQALQVQPGDECEVYLGAELVITGYVDALQPSIGPAGHSIRVSGRGRCQDLVDCSAIWPSHTINGGTVLSIAQKLAGAYGIGVVEANGVEVGNPIQIFPFSRGESPWSIIERICRYRAIMPYETAGGDLVLAAVGSTSAASGFQEGVNVQSATASFSMSGRYSVYTASINDTGPFFDEGEGPLLLATVRDAAVPRLRAREIIAEASGGSAGLDVAKRRAAWECSRRIGRSYQLCLTTDSWLDSAGDLWMPNTLVPLSLPSLKIENQRWLISEVTFHQDSTRGTTAELTIMPPNAFLVEPTVFQPFPLDVEQALGQVPPR